MHFDPCPGCPVRAGACWPRRANVARICAQLPVYGDQVASWGAEGGPEPTPAAEAPPFASFTDSARAQIESDRAFFLALSPDQKRRVAECDRRKIETRRTCCGGDGPAQVCRGGGRRDGQAVRTIDCARCVAEGGP